MRNVQLFTVVTCLIGSDLTATQSVKCGKTTDHAAPAKLTGYGCKARMSLRLMFLLLHKAENVAAPAVSVTGYAALSASIRDFDPQNSTNEDWSFWCCCCRFWSSSHEFERASCWQLLLLNCDSYSFPFVCFVIWSDFELFRQKFLQPGQTGRWILDGKCNLGSAVRVNDDSCLVTM